MRGRVRASEAFHQITQQTHAKSGSPGLRVGLRFVGDTPWAHIDIAGPAYTKKAQAYTEAGGTGFGVRLLCDLMERL